MTEENAAARIQIQQGDYEAAESTLKEILRVNTGNWEAHLHLGDIYFIKNLFHLAIAEYQKSLSIETVNFWAFRNMGNALVYLGEYEKAIPAYHAALTIAPESDLAWLELGDAFEALEQIGDADRCYARSGSLQRTVAITDAFWSPLHNYVYITGWVASSRPISKVVFCLDGEEIGRCTQEPLQLEWAKRLKHLNVHTASIRAESFVPSKPGIATLKAYGPDGPLCEAESAVRIIDEPAIEVTSGDGLLEIARKCADFGASATAAYYFRNALQERKREFSEISLQTAMTLSDIGRYHEALTSLQAVLNEAAQGNEEVYGQCFDFYCYLLGKKGHSALPDIDRMCDRDIEKNGDQYWSYLNKAHVQIGYGNRSLADDYYARARENRLENLFHLSRGVMSSLGLDQARRIPTDAEYTDRPFPNPVFEYTDIMSPECVHLVSCDAIYFKTYFEILAFSSARAADGKRITLHIHLINPTHDCLELFYRIRSQCSIELRLSTEGIRLDSLSYNARRAYFTVPRFLVANTVMEIYRAPVLITEVDCKIGWKWSEILDWVGSADIGLRTSAKRELVPWTRYPAGIIYLGRSSAAKRFITFVSNYIRDVFLWENGANSWTIDQTALWQAHDLFSGEMNICHLPMYSILHLAQNHKGGKFAFMAQSAE
ncbi:MAG: tetratricopeptide repeat protein [Alphaproteobacteria bacterium]|nr:tetratricopeptide repeat protein [Alphaproteobacteria bacterium]